MLNTMASMISIYGCGGKGRNDYGFAIFVGLFIFTLVYGYRMMKTMNRNLKKMAYYDSLTEAYNMYHFKELARESEEEVLQARMNHALQQIMDLKKDKNFHYHLIMNCGIAVSEPEGKIAVACMIGGSIVFFLLGSKFSET